MPSLNCTMHKTVENSIPMIGSIPMIEHFSDYYCILYNSLFRVSIDRATIYSYCRNRSSVCAVGFEPNPHHNGTLKAIERSYRECGRNVKFFTETAVSNK